LKKIKQYVCEFCGIAFKRKEECEKCEAGHKTPINITCYSYKPITLTKEGYPHRIHVEMDDGEIISYDYRG